MELKIDIDFKNILPPLSKIEYEELEKSILQKGVLSPIISWNDYIVDGHNRYQICSENGIDDFPIIEMDFSCKDEVLEWILSHQLGRRNLTDFQRNEVALKYEQIISERMRERQGTRTDLQHSDQMVEKFTPTSKRKELAKIANTSEGSIQRTKYILENGTEEQIERARKGGSGNSIGTIEREIKESTLTEKKCTKCGNILPITEFYTGKGYCKTCHNKISKKVVDLKGNQIAIAKEYRGLTEEEIIGDLYDTEKDIGYNSDDLREELNANIEQFTWSISNTLEMHRDLLLEENSKAKVFQEIDKLQNRLEELKVLYGCV